MGKKTKGNSAEKAMAKAAKKTKQEKSAQKKALKDQRKEQSRLDAHQPKKAPQGGGKKNKKPKANEEEDLDALLEQFKKEWETEHDVQEERQSGPPSRRANATLTACPLGTDLWLFGGEYFDGESANFYADLYRYTPHSGPVTKVDRLDSDSDSDEEDGGDGANHEVKDLGVWRTYSSKTQPGPRSAHQLVPTPQQGGLLWLFGGEFASSRMTSFHHYRDLWVFSVTDKTWERIDTRVKPSARSGHRMTAWKKYLVLFGGFVDTGARTTYLNDLWLFDMEEYKWVELPQNDFRRPGPRSGFSFLPTTDGVVLHGGYCKRYIKGQRSQGVQLEDTWMLKLIETTPTLQHPLGVKAEWVRRRKIGYAPNPPRSGCTMALWPARQIGVLFGGVTDTELDEESLESTFWNALYGYQLPGAGRWISLNLRRPKKMGGQGGKKKRAKAAAAAAAAKAKAEEIARRKQEQAEFRAWEQNDESDENANPEEETNQEGFSGTAVASGATKPPEASSAKADLMAQAATVVAEEDDDPDDPMKSVPLERYNAMLAVQRNTLYIYGGIYEQADREYTLDDFFTLDLVKMTRYRCLRACPIDSLEWHDSESESDGDEDDEDDDEDDEDDDDDDDDEDAPGGDAPEGVEFTEETEVHDSDYDDEELDPEERARIAREKEELRARATKFLGVSKDTGRSEEDILRTPQVGESVAAFYERSKLYWSQKALSQAEQTAGSDGLRGKELRRKAFELANIAYDEYRPLLREIERIHRDAGLDPADVKHGPGPAGTQPSVGMSSRNRR